MTRRRILILGGTGEGFVLAERLAARGDLEVISSMAGRTPAPKLPHGEIRRGGFGGAKGLADYLGSQHITAVIDATHPFAAQISHNAHIACLETGRPIMHIYRPPWQRQPGDHWIEVESVAAAAELVRYKYATGDGTVFLTTGKTELHHFASCRNVPFLARIVAPLGCGDDGRQLPPQLAFIYAKGPFDEIGETDVLVRHNVNLIVSKNSGGPAAYAKLAAARALAIPVLMVQRPPAPAEPIVEDAQGALDWLERLLGQERDAGNPGEL